MARDLNKVILIGRLTRDPEIKVVNTTTVASFSIANNNTYVSNGQKKEEVSYFDCEVWGKLAEILRDYTKKGKQILVEGRLHQSTWDTPDGKKASKIRVRVENFQLLGARDDAAPRSQSHEESSNTAYESNYSGGMQEVDVEDIF
ncbi:MAG: single-stranded DNA-binding protein [Leptospiraceae bacterium]|nr:single-stranded DNA-binding protein [Leptospiraceae bacterium]